MGQPQQPSPPDPTKTFQGGLDVWQKFLKKGLPQEQRYREKYDPQRIAEQQALQAQFGPTQYAQQLQALQQLDPQRYAGYEGLGAIINTMLRRGSVNPQQADIYNQIGNVVSQNLARGGVDPTQKAAYDAYGLGATADYNRGATLGRAESNELSDLLGARQAATGNYLGNAPAMAQAVYTGRRGQELRQQRTGNLQNFLGLPPPELAALQSAYMQQGLQTPQEKFIAQTGSYLSLPSNAQQASQITSVAPDRSFGYLNPNAGYMGQQFGLQNYPNQAYGANQPNPWMNALGGAAAGAASGTMISPGYGTAIGAIAGGLGGYFSDPKMKTDVKKIGNVPIYEYRYKPRYGIPGTFRSPMSTDVKKLDSGAVTRVLGHDFVRSPNSLGLNRVKVKEE